MSHYPGRKYQTLEKKEIPLKKKKKLIVKTTESNGYNLPPFLDTDIYFQCPSPIDVNLLEKISVLSWPIILAVPIHISGSVLTLPHL